MPKYALLFALFAFAIWK